MHDAPVIFVNHWGELEGVLRKYARNTEALEENTAKSVAYWKDRLEPSKMAIYVARELNRAGETLLTDEA